MKKIDPIQKHIDDNAYIKKRNIEADLKISDIVRIAATNMGSMTKIVQNGSKTPIGFMFENLGKNGGYKPHEILNNNRGVVDDSVYSMTYSVGKFVEGKKESHMLSISIKKSGKAESVVTNVNLIYGKDKSADIQTLKEIGGEVGSAK
ncbi:MAG TPA: hypothetical protein VM577_17855, partial [Anaerovoracaceae bacterium]|nr:hypothetical protein [Anaerovoracaceae bacterium]